MQKQEAAAEDVRLVDFYLDMTHYCLYSLAKSIPDGKDLTGEGKKFILQRNHKCCAGNIAKWNKKEGDEIAAGDSIAEIETDKATMDWEAQDDGFVAKLLVEEGAKDVGVGQPVIVIVEEQVTPNPKASGSLPCHHCWRSSFSSGRKAAV